MVEQKNLQSGSSEHSFDDLVRLAEDGDPAAQRNLAIVFHNGDGVAQDRDAASFWLQKAVEGGDPWALTTHAIDLRSTKDPELAIESTRLLEQAASKGDARGHLTLGIHLIEGIGTQRDTQRGIAELIMASLAGQIDAQELLSKFQDALSKEEWSHIFDQVRWSNLTFVMGPLVDGHLSGLTRYRPEDDGDSEAPWLQYEKESADLLFLSGSNAGSVIDSLFDAAVRVEKIYVGRAIVGGENLAAVTINYRNIIGHDGQPVWQMPTAEKLDGLVATIAFIDARKWIRWMYNHF